MTETDYLEARRRRIAFDDALIAEFARYFGQPSLRLEIDPQARTIARAEVVRDACCGCARHVAQGLVGKSVDEAEFEAGMLHHHFPCLASMGIDPDFDDTLMHVSGQPAARRCGGASQVVQACADDSTGAQSRLNAHWVV